MRRLVAMLVLGMALWGSAWADAPKGPEDRSRAWDALKARKEALARKGDVERGKLAYATCAPCHQWSGVGQSDGLFPQLAGQHSSVLIKQLVDIRVGMRDSNLMYPVAATLRDPQELADLAAFIATLEASGQNGKGPGTLAEKGERLFRSRCAACHGPHGEGNAAAAIPLVGGQHFRYLVRQLIDIREGTRRNADPTMRKLVATMSNQDLTALADYLAQLGGPPRPVTAPDAGTPVTPGPPPAPTAPGKTASR